MQPVCSACRRRRALLALPRRSRGSFLLHLLRAIAAALAGRSLAAPDPPRRPPALAIVYRRAA